MKPLDAPNTKAPRRELRPQPGRIEPAPLSIPARDRPAHARVKTPDDDVGVAGRPSLEATPAKMPDHRVGAFRHGHSGRPELDVGLFTGGGGTSRVALLAMGPQRCAAVRWDSR